MIPRTNFRIDQSPFTIDPAVYKRFDSAKEACVLVGRQDTDNIGPTFFMEKLNAKMVENIQRNVEGKSRADYALMMGARAIHFILGAYGDQNANKQFLKWAPLYVPEFLSKSPAMIAPDQLTCLVVRAAAIYGADLVGIANLDLKWVYSRDIHKPFIFKDVDGPMETQEAFIIPNSISKAIVMAPHMNRRLILGSPSAEAFAATDLGYSRMAWLSILLAEFIRALGYHAIPCMNDTTLSIPLAIAAGLGQAGRHGMLITPEYGPCVRLCKVLTDMPLQPNQPIDFGMTEFCKQCLACARACPAGAISFEDQTFVGVCESNNPGVKKWYVHAERCLRFWQANGSACANCIAVCPFTSTEKFASIQCLCCEKCIAPNCTFQLIVNERQKYGYDEGPSSLDHKRTHPSGL
jgi:epoxyqueuosine reductase